MILAAFCFWPSALVFPESPIPNPQSPLPACLVRVVDGDTLRLDIDLGANVTLRNQAVRILGIDAPELHGPERPRGLASKAALESKIQNLESKIRIALHGKDKYGRWLADIFAGGENVALWMLRQGHARHYQIGRHASESPQDASLDAQPCPTACRTDESL